MDNIQKKIKIKDLKEFCEKSLIREGMSEDYARITAEVLVETDKHGTHSHGSKNLYGYIKKFRAGGMNIKAQPEVIKDGPAFAIIDAQNAIGSVSSFMAMNLACKKANEMGIAIVCVKNSSHFGAAGYYANMAAKQGMLGISMSNVDPNMTVPGAKGMLIGNNPLAYAVPALSNPSVFLDIAMSSVASLKVIQAKKDKVPIPDTWIVDGEGLPTTDPSRYPEEGAMQPMSNHKGYGLAVLVEILTGALSGGAMSMMGDVVSWCFQLEKPNNVCHTFIAIDVEKFIGKEEFTARIEEMSERLRSAPKAKGCNRIFTPGEIEWEKHKEAELNALVLPHDVVDALEELQKENGIAINWAY